MNKKNIRKKEKFDIELCKKEKCIKISLNPNLYNLNVIYTACYAMLEKAYFLLDGDPKEKIIVKIWPKLDSIVNEKKTNKKVNKKKQIAKELKKISTDFLDNLINLGFYNYQNLENMPIKATILQRVLFTAYDEHIKK